jgi:ribosome-binding factor A
MPSHRVQRVAEAIREVVAQAILFEVADPRVKGVTVLHAEVSADLRQATVYVSLMGTPAEQKLALRGLGHATGFLQAKVAARLQIRHTPVLRFKVDEGVKKSVEISRLIDEALESDRKAHAPGQEDTHSDDASPDAALEAEDPSDEDSPGN